MYDFGKVESSLRGKAKESKKRKGKFPKAAGKQMRGPMHSEREMRSMMK